MLRKKIIARGKCDAEVTSRNGASPMAMFHRLGFLFGIFGFIQNDRISLRGIPRLSATLAPASAVLTGFVFAAAPVKMSFAPGFSYHRRIPSVSRGRLLLMRFELGAHSGFQV